MHGPAPGTPNRLKRIAPRSDDDSVQRSPFAPPATEDEQADDAVRRGRNAGGVWIVASVAAFGVGLVADSVAAFALTWTTGAALFAIGLVRRAQFWRAARRRLGDATIQRARWRRAEADRESPDRLWAAVALVLVLVGYELWRK